MIKGALARRLDLMGQLSENGANLTALHVDFARPAGAPEPIAKSIVLCICGESVWIADAFTLEQDQWLRDAVPMAFSGDWKARQFAVSDQVLRRWFLRPLPLQTALLRNSRLRGDCPFAR
ncbi:hypothetical protein FEV53_18325 [Palleronia caenipelagi]|uniref:Uncharacterized protein n=1 Tax=Palleronia caenipelagi TaxID=2489174 RepID=A0A547PL04_9RHOB|nr:hypothetical protein FEV53_18325 [Palleronia caenipelagi]